MRSDDRLYVLQVLPATGPSEVWGPYPTAKQAVKGAQEATQGFSGASYKPLFLFRPGQGMYTPPKIPLCPLCNHPSWTHGFPRGLGCAIELADSIYCGCQEAL
jgi:hypothetical protein